MAGTDTTATAIRATLLHLITNPRVYNKLRAEFDANPWDTPVISDAHARTLPYLQAVVKEGLRIFPPVAALMTKVAPPQGDTFKDIHIPGGTRIGYCGWGIMRDRDTFGDDANEYKPERWIEASPEQLRKMETTLDLVFHAGRYQCLGKAIALMELNKVFPTVSILRLIPFVLEKLIMGISCSRDLISTSSTRPSPGIARTQASSSRMISGCERARANKK